MDSLQSLMGLMSLVCTILNFQLVIALAVESVADGNTDMAAVNAVIDTVSMNLVTYLGLMGAWTTANSILLDIPQHEEEMTKQFATRTHLRIGDLTDTACHKMTHFYHGQLRRLYTAFDLEGYLLQLNVEMLSFYTGYTSPRSGSQCCYRIHPEEVFLFTMTKVATGLSNQRMVDMYIGGDYARWSHAYPWMLKYLDKRYRDIIGHQGLTRVINQFPERKLIAVQELHTYSSLNKEFVDNYAHTIDLADIAVIYLNPKAVSLKKLELMDESRLQHAFRRKDLILFTEIEKLKAFLESFDYVCTNLLLMSSGNYDDMDLSTLKSKINQTLS